MNEYSLICKKDGRKIVDIILFATRNQCFVLFFCKKQKWLDRKVLLLTFFYGSDNVKTNLKVCLM